MRVIPIAAPVIALGVLLGGFAAVSHPSQPAGPRAATVALAPAPADSGPGNNGNG